MPNCVQMDAESCKVDKRTYFDVRMIWSKPSARVILHADLLGLSSYRDPLVLRRGRKEVRAAISKRPSRTIGVLVVVDFHSDDIWTSLTQHIAKIVCTISLLVASIFALRGAFRVRWCNRVRGDKAATSSGEL